MVIRIAWTATISPADANNAILATVGYNFRRLIRWLTLLLALVLLAISPPPKSAVA
jgi:hypothetical protein